MKTYAEAMASELNATTMDHQLEQVVEDPELPIDLVVALAELRAAYQAQAESYREAL